MSCSPVMPLLGMAPSMSMKCSLVSEMYTVATNTLSEMAESRPLAM